MTGPRFPRSIYRNPVTGQLIPAAFPIRTYAPLWKKPNAMSSNLYHGIFVYNPFWNPQRFPALHRMGFDQVYDTSTGADRVSTIKRSQDNPLMPELYNVLLKGRVHELLHVHYKKD